jgi:hypothetical protein
MWDMGEVINAYSTFFRETGRDIEVHNNIKADLKELVCQDVDQVHLEQDEVQW